MRSLEHFPPKIKKNKKKVSSAGLICIILNTQRQVYQLTRLISLFFSASISSVPSMYLLVAYDSLIDVRSMNTADKYTILE